MSIVSEINRIKSNIASSYEKVKLKGGTIPSVQNSNNLPAAIESIPEGGGPSGPIIEGNGEYEIRFIDYDGTLLKIQYCNEGESATAPQLPVHDNLTFIGWNCDFTNINSDVDTGALYDTTDKKTHIIARFTEETGRDVDLNIYISRSGTGSISWGDGTSTSIPTGTGYKTYSHTYTDYGEYDIAITKTTTYYLGGNTSMLYVNKCLFGDMGINKTNKIQNAIIKVYLSQYCTELQYNALRFCENLEEISFGELVRLYTYAVYNSSKLKACIFGIGTSWNAINRLFGSLPNCKYIPIPDNFTTSSTPIFGSTGVEKVLMGKIDWASTSFDYMAYYYSGARKVVYPQVTNITTIGYCNYNGLVEEIILPPAVTTLKTGCFQQNYSLRKITIPATVTSMADQALYGNISMTDVYMYPTTPPTLGGTNVFTNTAPNLVIHVPAESLEEYKAATNWSTHASKMVGDL